MSCGGCSKRMAVKKERYEVLGGYGSLPDKQIKARLEVYKKRYCKECNDRYKCDFVMYSDCRKSVQNKALN